MAPEPVFSAISRLALVAAAGLGAAGCYSGDSGREPDVGRIYFPVGIALGPSETSETGVLYLANSDFDLQFNAGSLQAYDLDRLREFVPKYCREDSECDGGKVCDVAKPGEVRTSAPSHYCVAPGAATPCAPLSEQSPGDRLLYPGRCGVLDPRSPPGGAKSLLVNAVQIGAFVTDALYHAAPSADGRGRLFLPVRGDATLHWIDVDTSGGLECGQAADGSCDRNHRRGGDASENSRGVRLPPEPFGIAADAKGEAIVTTHQSDGQVALFVNQWTATDERPVGPSLEFVAGDLPSGALAITAIPEPRLVTSGLIPCIVYQPGFLMTFRNSAEVRLVRYFNDQPDCANAGTEPARPFIDASRTVGITTNTFGFNSRGIAIDASAREACERKCVAGSADEQACLTDCAPTPVDVFVSNRTPASLILGRTRPNRNATASDDLPTFYASLMTQAGASRVIVGDIRDEDAACADSDPPVAPGQCRTRRVFVVCFDSRLIFVYDPKSGNFDAVINTGRGPHAFAVDSEHGLGYVGHFTDSYLGVVDLDRRHTETYGKMLLTVGQPVAPRASK